MTKQCKELKITQIKLNYFNFYLQIKKTFVYLYNRQSENINNPSLLYLAVSIERDLFFKKIMSIEILEIKIDNLNIDLSDKVYYYAKVKKDKQNFILQMVTDGIINHHLDLKQWKDYIINKMNY